MKNDLEDLDGDEAARRFANDPDSIFFPIGSFITQFGLTEIEFRAEAAAGRLQVRGTPTTDGYSDCHITGGDVCKWLAHGQTPRKFKDHFRRLKHAAAN